MRLNGLNRLRVYVNFTCGLMTGLKSSLARKILFGIGLTMASVFALVVSVPFYLQGYAELEDELLPGEGLGWTKNNLLGTVAYLLTFREVGVTYLVIGMICILFARVPGNLQRPLTILGIKGMPLLFYVWSLFEFHRYEAIINAVLE